jgi:hypothetical protein
MSVPSVMPPANGDGGRWPERRAAMILCAVLRPVLCEGWTCCLVLLPLLDLRDETSVCCKPDIRVGASDCDEFGFRDETSTCGKVGCGEWDLGVGERGGEDLTAGSAGPFSFSAC